MKTIALLLIGVQASTLVPPCPPGARDAPACRYEAAATVAAVIDSGECEACGMSDCLGMDSCAQTATALISAPGTSWTAPTPRAVDPTFTRTLSSLEQPPVRPPPRTA